MVGWSGSIHRELECRYRRDKVVGWRCSIHRELEWRYRRDKVV